MTTDRQSIAVAPGSPTFELHTLGWRAFQDLCASVLREVLGQSVQAFADSRDAGRDGAFYGEWRAPRGDSAYRDFLEDGAFVVQIKHTSRAGATLTPSSLKEELAKVQDLVVSGLCDSYVLLTNAAVSGRSESRITEILRDLGVRHPHIFGGSWISQTIARHAELRMLVPRVYGLGDLSQILDTRAYAQTASLLRFLREDLATFVVTEAYQRAAESVRNHGFVLLLGEPAAGKTVIAATLAIAALDMWKCATVKPKDASELVARWNPNEPNQFFWVDDAFGVLRHERGLTEDWAHRMLTIMAAVSSGARVVLTSRDYIYRAARPYLKEDSHPLLAEQQVVVDVTQLSRDERERILYNHVRMGDQPQEFRRALKPYLDSAADVQPFRPEGARRLGRRVFTRGLAVTSAGVNEFIVDPSGFLQTVFEQLDSHAQAALTLIYMAGEQPLAPVLRPAEVDIAYRLGSSPGDIGKSLAVLDGTFVRYQSGQTSGLAAGWEFYHPTLREGFARLVANRPLLLDVFLAGLSDDSLLSQIDCGSGEKRGTLLQVPPALYPLVAARLSAMPLEDRRIEYAWHRFFVSRCSASFLEHYLALDDTFIKRLLNFTSYLFSTPEPEVLARLAQLGLLPESARIAAIGRVAELAVETPDADWLDAAEWQTLMTESERSEILKKVEADLIPQLHDTIWDWRLNYDASMEPSSYFDPLENALLRYERALADPSSQASLRHAREEVEALRSEAEDDYSPPIRESLLGRAGRVSTPRTTDRSIFDDVDQ